LGFWSKPKDSPSYTGLFCIAAMEINADTCEKKKRLQKQAQVIEAGFIQARNLSSSVYFISLSFGISKLKV